MAKGNIWILNHHADTNGHRHYELAREFSSQGCMVTVIASSYSHYEHKYEFKDECHIDKIADNFNFIYLHTQPAYQKNSIGRVLNMLDYLHLVKKNEKKIRSIAGKPDYVIGSCVHPLAWEAAYWLSKRYGAKFICEVRDFWPLSLIEINGMSEHHPLVKFFGIIEKRAYKRADKIVTTFPYGYRHICDDIGYPRDKVVWIPNGIRIEDSKPDAVLPDDLFRFLSEHWCCIYAGSFVKSEGLDFMLDAFNLLKDEDIYFAIIGNGHEKDALQKKIDELGLTKVRIYPRINKAQVMVAHHSAQCCLAAHRSAQCCLAAHQNHSIYRFGLSMNKLSDYLLSGNPVIFACDAPNVVKEAGHVTMAYGDIEAFADAIRGVKSMNDAERREMSERGNKIIREQYDYRIISKKYIDMLESL